VVSIKNVQGDGQAKQYDVKLGSALMAYDFFLVTDEAAAKLRRQKAEGRRGNVWFGSQVQVH
jgi:hypothetical protein